MYLYVNLTLHIVTLGSVLILTSYHMIRQLLKFTVSPHHLLLRFHSPKIRILLLIWQPLIP